LRCGQTARVVDLADPLLRQFARFSPTPYPWRAPRPRPSQAWVFWLAFSLFFGCPSRPAWSIPVPTPVLIPQPAVLFDSSVAVASVNRGPLNTRCLGGTTGPVPGGKYSRALPMAGHRPCSPAGLADACAHRRQGYSGPSLPHPVPLLVVPSLACGSPMVLVPSSLGSPKTCDMSGAQGYIPDVRLVRRIGA